MWNCVIDPVRVCRERSWVSHWGPWWIHLGTFRWRRYTCSWSPISTRQKSPPPDHQHLVVSSGRRYCLVFRPFPVFPHVSSEVTLVQRNELHLANGSCLSLSRREGQRTQTPDAPLLDFLLLPLYVSREDMELFLFSSCDSGGSSQTRKTQPSL